jgi:hypothetical protein
MNVLLSSQGLKIKQASVEAAGFNSFHFIFIHPIDQYIDIGNVKS